MNTVTTNELQHGDIVITHGMRCLIDGEINSRDWGCGPAPTYWTEALVLNRDEVPNEVVPVSWTKNWKRDAPPNGEHRWTIQGNVLAHWYVERVA